MAFNARNAGDSARRLMSGKRSTRTASKARATVLPVTRLARGPSANKDKQLRNDRGMKARMAKTSNIGP